MPYSIITYVDWNTIQLFTVRLHVQNSTSIRKVSAINEIQPSKNVKTKMQDLKMFQANEWIFTLILDPVKDANWWTVWKRKVIKFEKQQQTTAEKNKTTLLYLISLAILTAGASYAAVPLYRMFCSATGYGGTTQAGHDTEKVETMKPKKDRVITIKFTADTAASMQWNFRPQQYSIDVYAGETALAFYTVSAMS